MRESTIQVRGRVIARLRDTFFRVAVSDQDTIIARISGKMQNANIKVIAGDDVIVEMTPYDLTRGRIVYRYRLGL
jgi:translation initiation factor IF-1